MHSSSGEPAAPVPGGLHDHRFGEHRPKAGEGRTRLVIAVTAVTMVVEVTAGVAFGSMALLADGLHMASHAAALAVTAVAYAFARRHAGDRRFSFGTGKVNALAGFASAVLLALFALLMAGESLSRFLSPVDIRFNEAIAVAVLGLVVNGASVLILDTGRGSSHHERELLHPHHHDHNLRAAYLHVLADALTSVLAIVALVAGKTVGAVWLDPVMGIVGAILVARWSVGLLRDSGSVLLDRQDPERLVELAGAVEGLGGVHVEDLHLWAIGSGNYAAIVAVRCDRQRSPQEVAAAIPDHLHVVHLTVEVTATGSAGV